MRKWILSVVFATGCAGGSLPADRGGPCGAEPAGCAHVCAYDRASQSWEWVSSYSGCSAERAPASAGDSACGAPPPEPETMPSCGFSCVGLRPLGVVWVANYGGC